MKCTDHDSHVVRIDVYDLRDVNYHRFTLVPWKDGSLFSSLNGYAGCRMNLRVSDAVETPDRHAEIERILEGRDPMRFFLISALIKRLRSRGITFFGGPVGSQDLYDAGYEGFYLLSDGLIAECRDAGAPDPDSVGCIADGAVSYTVLSPAHFSVDSEARLYGFLRGDRFSDFEETLYKGHGKVVSCLGRKGEEMHDILSKARRGDAQAAAVASHRLRLNISP